MKKPLSDSERLSRDAKKTLTEIEANLREASKDAQEAKETVEKFQALLLELNQTGKTGAKADALRRGLERDLAAAKKSEQKFTQKVEQFTQLKIQAEKHYAETLIDDEPPPTR